MLKDRDPTVTVEAPVKVPVGPPGTVRIVNVSPVLMVPLVVRLRVAPVRLTVLPIVKTATLSEVLPPTRCIDRRPALAVAFGLKLTLRRIESVPGVPGEPGATEPSDETEPAIVPLPP